MKMKNIFAIFFVLNCLLVFSCKNNSEQTLDNYPVSNFFKIEFYKSNIDTTTIVRATTITEDKDFVAKYICPNHCEGSGALKEGVCKTCEMELIENLDK